MSTNGLRVGLTQRTLLLLARIGLGGLALASGLGLLRHVGGSYLAVCSGLSALGWYAVGMQLTWMEGEKQRFQREREKRVMYRRAVKRWQ